MLEATLSGQRRSRLQVCRRSSRTESLTVSNTPRRAAAADFATLCMRPPGHLQLRSRPSSSAVARQTAIASAACLATRHLHSDTASNSNTSGGWWRTSRPTGNHRRVGGCCHARYSGVIECSAQLPPADEVTDLRSYLLSPVLAGIRLGNLQQPSVRASFDSHSEFRSRSSVLTGIQLGGDRDNRIRLAGPRPSHSPHYPCASRRSSSRWSSSAHRPWLPKLRLRRRMTRAVRGAVPRYCISNSR